MNTTKMEPDTVRIGFTGTREGMSDSQKTQVAKLVRDLIGEAQGEVHHGDCVGADSDFHNICLSLSVTDNIIIKIIVHPPVNSKAQAFCKGDESHIPKPYMDRNRDIVDASDTMIACPRSMEREPHSGTWLTVGYTEQKNKPLHIIV